MRGTGGPGSRVWCAMHVRCGALVARGSFSGAGRWMLYRPVEIPTRPLGHVSPKLARRLAPGWANSAARFLAALLGPSSLADEHGDLRGH